MPLDYDHPHGRTTTLAIAREKASDPARRIGTLFVNPGGPGGSATGFVSYVAQHLGRRTRQRFDIVGVDPRGVGGSAELVCHDPTPRGAPRQLHRPFPYTVGEIGRWLRFDAYLDHICAVHSSPILDHMSTADTARDMDLVRQALGDRKLTYYGLSYGTYLGATYAAMFPDNIRAMVVDGVLDPVAWATGRHGNGRKVPLTSRLRSGTGAWLALTSAFAECDRVGRPRCALAGQAASKWEQVIERLRSGPATIQGFTYQYSYVVGLVLTAMYSRAVYPALMRVIAFFYESLFPSHKAESQLEPGRAVRSLNALIDESHATRPYGFGARHLASFDGIACSDSVNPSDPKAWIAAAHHTDRVSPWFGADWTWASSACAAWPGSSADAFRGPFKVKTSTPVLVVGNANDPATPISGARRLNGLLAGSRLLTLDGWGHGALGEGRCPTRVMQRYLVHRRLPVEGKVCRPATQLFPR